MKEHDLQIAVANFLNSQERYRKTFTWFHPPSSIWTSKAQAGKHKAYGMRAGVPDCIIFAKEKTLSIELKTPKGYMTPAQKEFNEKLNNLGHHTYLVKAHTPHGAIKQVEKILHDEGVL